MDNITVYFEGQAVKLCKEVADFHHLRQGTIIKDRNKLCEIVADNCRIEIIGCELKNQEDNGN
jgi:hypothetical protein